MLAPDKVRCIGDCLRALKPHYEEALQSWAGKPAVPYERNGIGIGAMWYGIGNTGAQNPSTARLDMDLDGTVTLFTGCADIGQGSSTVLSQIAAEVLGLAPQAIRLVTADTRFTINAGATSASRQTYISGNAVKQAAVKLADVLKTEAVNKLKAGKPALIAGQEQRLIRLTKVKRCDTFLLNCDTGETIMPISLRIPPKIEQLINRAAKKEGKTKTAFILDAVDEKLRLVENREQTIRKTAGWISPEEACRLSDDLMIFEKIDEADWQ